MHFHVRILVRYVCIIMYSCWLTTVCALKITMFGQCKGLDYPAIRLSAIHTENGHKNAVTCVEQCARRPRCMVASFARLYAICFLFDSEAVLDTSGDTVKDCIYISKVDFEGENKLVSSAILISALVFITP